jgi:hypothetical protein
MYGKLPPIAKLVEEGEVPLIEVSEGEVAEAVQIQVDPGRGVEVDGRDDGATAVLADEEARHVDERILAEAEVQLLEVIAQESLDGVQP